MTKREQIEEILCEQYPLNKRANSKLADALLALDEPREEMLADNYDPTNKEWVKIKHKQIGNLPLPTQSKEDWEVNLRHEWREEVKRFPEMDSLGSADWWINKLLTAKQEAAESAVEYVKEHGSQIMREDGPHGWTVTEDLLEQAKTAYKNKD